MRHRGAGKLTSDTPLSAVVLVDVGNHWSDDKTGDLPTGIESSQSSTGRVVEIFLPGWEGLQTRDNVPFIWTVRTSGGLLQTIGLHPLRIKPTQRILRKLHVNTIRVRRV